MKKGFTLIEVTAVILILALLTLITVPKIKNIIANKNQNAHDLIINSIESAAKSYVYMNSNEIDAAIETYGNYYVDIFQLKESKLIENSILDPITKEEISNEDVVQVGKFGDIYIITYLGNRDNLLNASLIVELGEGMVDENQSGTYTVGTPITLEISHKDGYVFTGWNKVSGNCSISGNTIILGTGTTIIKATYDLVVLLTIDISGGGYNNPLAENQSGEYVEGAEIELNTVTKDGYLFDHWEKISGNSVIDGNNLIMGSIDTQIKAIFIRTTYTITYNCNGGEGNTLSSIHTYNISSKLSKNGCYKFSTVPYSFKGWGLSPDSTSVTYTDEQSMNDYVPMEENLDLYAVYSPLLSVTGNYTFTNEGNGNWKLIIRGATGSTSGTATIVLNSAISLDIFLVGGGFKGSAGTYGDYMWGGTGGSGGYSITYRNKSILADTYSIVVGAINGGTSSAFGYNSNISGASINAGGQGGFSGAGYDSLFGGNNGSCCQLGTKEFGEASGTDYAGGGGGGAGDGIRFGTTGKGTGGAGGGGTGGYNGSVGTANTGGGGGGGGANNSGYDGGSGIVIIRNAR